MTCPSFCKTEGCTVPYGKHMSFSIAAAALPSSGRAKRVRQVDAKDAALARDGQAYRNLRRDGLQPPRVNGCHALERDAVVAEHVTMGRTDIQPAAYRAFEDVMGHKATEAA